MTAVDDAKQIEGPGTGMRLLGEWSSTDAEAVAILGFWFRLLFRIAGAIPAATTAHRILRSRL